MLVVVVSSASRNAKDNLLGHKIKSRKLSTVSEMTRCKRRSRGILSRWWRWREKLRTLAKLWPQQKVDSTYCDWSITAPSSSQGLSAFGFCESEKRDWPRRAPMDAQETWDILPSKLLNDYLSQDKIKSRTSSVTNSSSGFRPPVQIATIQQYTPPTRSKRIVHHSSFTMCCQLALEITIVASWPWVGSHLNAPFFTALYGRCEWPIVW